jgi:hypothetical protein
MIPPSVLMALSTHPEVPAASQRAFRDTLKLEHAWRDRRAALRTTSKPQSPLSAVPTVAI